MLAVWIVVGVVVLAALWVVYAYNRLVRLRVNVDNAWSQIDVQLRRRYDLIPNLIESVKGYAAHEREVFEDVTKARAAARGRVRGPRPGRRGEPGQQVASAGCWRSRRTTPT